MNKRRKAHQGIVDPPVVAKKPEAKECGVCGIIVGEGYLEGPSYPLGGFELCGTCHNYINKYGFLQIEEHPARRLMLDGTVQNEYINVGEGREKNPLYLPNKKIKGILRR